MRLNGLRFGFSDSDVVFTGKREAATGAAPCILPLLETASLSANMHSMARIVTSTYRYKRPPKKRKAPALEVPAVVNTEKSRRRPSKQAAAESVSRSPRLHDGAAQPSTARDAECDGTVTTPPPVRKSAIVTARRGKRITATHDDDGGASPEIKAFFARMICPRGQ